MKLSLILLLLVTSIKVCALNVYPVSVNSLASSIAFKGVENINLPADGDLISNYYFTNEEIFDGGTTYKRIHHINPNSPNWNPDNFWPYNSANHTFTLDVIQASSGAKWRQIYSLENGPLHYQAWNNLTTGVNSISITPEGNYDRSVIGFETDGSFKFRKFSHEFGSQSWGYEEILVAIPEPSTYALILGMLVLNISLRKNSKRPANFIK